MPRSSSVALTTAAPAASPKSEVTARPRVLKSSAAEWVSEPTTSTCLAAPERTMPLAVASP
jgi:hypothetical protein